MKGLKHYIQIVFSASSKKIAIISFGVVLLLLVFILLRPIVLRSVYSGDLPKQPNLSGYAAPVKEYVEQVYSEALQKPYSDEKVGKLAMVYHSNFFYNEAELCYNAAIKLNDEEWKWYYFLALIKEELGDSKSTIDNLEKVVALNPEVTNAWFRLGNSYFKQNEFDAAESAFKKVVAMAEFVYEFKTNDRGAFPLKVYAGLNLSRIYLQQEKYEQTKAVLIKLTEEYPTFGPAYRLLGQVYSSENDVQKAEEYTTIAGDFESYIPPADPMFNELILQSRNSDFILKQIDLARRSENILWAEDLCRFILGYDPGDMEAVNKYILSMLESFHYADLEAKLKQYYDHYINDDAKLASMAQTLYRWNQDQLALGFLKRAIEVNPLEPESHILYIKIAANNKPDQALLQHCERAISIIKNNSNLYTEYGRVLALIGREKEARKQFDLALSINPNNEVTLILLGVIAQEKGETEAALNYYRRSVKINPLNVNTILKFGNYLMELKRWDEALKVFQKSLDDSPNNIELLERYSMILAACPDPHIRNGEKALELAKRISFIRKETPEQDVKCAITLAVSYAETGDFTSAGRVLKNVTGRAKKIRMGSYIPEIESMMRLFESEKPYRL